MEVIIVGWMQTYTGLKVDPDNLAPEAICIEDIAHALSMQCRFNGHVKRFYSIAEHSIYVARLVPESLRLHALLHDASEAYLCDIPSPLKSMLGGYARLEARFQQTIFDKFRVPGTDARGKQEVKKADLQMLLLESQQLMVPPPDEWDFGGVEAPERVIRIRGWEPAEAEWRFLKAFDELMWVLDPSCWIMS